MQQLSMCANSTHAICFAHMHSAFAKHCQSRSYAVADLAAHLQEQAGLAGFDCEHRRRKLIMSGNKYQFDRDSMTC